MNWFRKETQKQYVRTEEKVTLQKANISVKLLSGETIDVSVEDEMRDQAGVLNGEQVTTRTRYTLAQDKIKDLESSKLGKDGSIILLLNPTKEVIIPTHEISKIEVELLNTKEDTAIYFKPV